MRAKCVVPFAMSTDDGLAPNRRQAVKFISKYWICCIMIRNSVIFCCCCFVCLINNSQALVQLVAWDRTGIKLLSGPMLRQGALISSPAEVRVPIFRHQINWLTDRSLALHICKYFHCNHVIDIYIIKNQHWTSAMLSHTDPIRLCYGMITRFNGW